MSLPHLIDYPSPVPPTRTLPQSRAAWTLDPTRAAVLVHDLQRYFLRPFAPGCPALSTALAGTARILTQARAAGVPVFYTAQDGDHSDRGLQGDLWGGGMSAHPDDTAIVAEVAPAESDHIVTKRRYSAFTKSDLAERLTGLARDQLVITGVYAHIGITATAFDAFQREVRPFVVADAVAAFTHDQHVRSLDLVADSCGVVAMTDAVVDALTPVPGVDASPWDTAVSEALTRALAPDVLAAALADPDADLFALGLNSLRAFEVLDDLAEAGVDIDFGDLVRSPSVAFLRAQGRALTPR